MSDPTVVYTGPRFRVESRTLRGADGRDHRFDVVVHPGAAVVLPLLDDGRIALIESHRAGVGRTLLELPAGTIDPPESPLECARRELLEETGYAAGSLEPLLSFYTSPGICTELMHAFVASGLRAGETAHEPLEFIRVVRLEVADALRRIETGGIMDGKSIATLLYYDAFRRGQRRP